MKPALTRVISWAHELLSEVVAQGDTVIDLTAGNGHDTLALARLVGADGCVVAFDIQEAALWSTADRLTAEGLSPVRIAVDGGPVTATGVFLVHGSHAAVDGIVQTAPAGVIANLGYLPGGDPAVITRPETTCTALHGVCNCLAPGGRLAVVVYPGHSGGQQEAERVDDFFAGLAEDSFETLCLRVTNRSGAPYLHVAERRRGKPSRMKF